MAKKTKVVKAETESSATQKRAAKTSPLPVNIVETLKATLTIKDKMDLLDWSFLIAGIGGGMYTQHWENTITLSQLFDILTDGLSQSDFDDVISKLLQADSEPIQSGGDHV